MNAIKNPETVVSEKFENLPRILKNNFKGIANNLT